ncbi:YitT family protein [Halalkalibacter oceani]|uniref:YitT family protein n=1 Tax=Halalkalibacter oceani TaxID=1653776 RepID=UPI003392DD3A
MFLGVFLFVVGNIIFALPNEISPGGIVGLSNLLYYWFNYDIGVSYFLLNVPLFILAWRISKPLFNQSILSMILCSIMLGFLEPLSFSLGVDNVWAGSLLGGLIIGAGLGVLGLTDSSLGGGSLSGKMLNMKFGLSFGLTTFMIDSLVFPLSLFVIGITNTFFSIILAFFSFMGIVVIDFLAGNVPQIKKSKVIAR